MHGPVRALPRRNAAPAVAIVAALGLALVALTALGSLAFGVADVPLHAVVPALLHRLGLGGTASEHELVVVDLRLPRALGACCVGGALGTAGCMLQALLRNALASPTVVGSAQGAMFGAMVAFALSLPHAAALTAACAGALAAVALVLSMARTRRSLPVESVVLTGMAVSMLFMALARLLIAVTRDEYALGRMTQWLTGGLWHVTWEQLALLGPVALVAVVVACLGARSLDVLALGEADAHRLGLRVRRTGTIVLLLSCVLTAVAICIGGMVAFIGLIVPHAGRRLVGPMHAALVPASACLGAVLVVATDTVARTAIPPQELPLTVVTSLVGVPAFLLLLRAMRARSGR